MPDIKEKLVCLLSEAKSKSTEMFSFERELSYRESLEVEVDHLIANGVGFTPKWIPVAERLPQEDIKPGEPCKLVQVLLKNGSVTVGFCNRGMECWFYMPINETRFMGNHYDTTPVIAWQPLALPPAKHEGD